MVKKMAASLLQKSDKKSFVKMLNEILDHHTPVMHGVNNYNSIKRRIKIDLHDFN